MRHILTSITCYARLAPTCAVEVPLVSGPSPIPDNQMTASSIFGTAHEPYYARLHTTGGGGGWCPTYAERDAPEPNMYTQVSIKGDVLYMYLLHVYILLSLVSSLWCIV